MEKKIVVIAAAALLFGSTIGYAASSSLVGAKVTGLFLVEKDGKRIADAVIINGSAYVPVRAMSEAIGTGLTVKGKTITMEVKAAAIEETGTTVAEPVSTPAASVDPAKLKERVTALESRVKLFDDAIAKEEANLYLMDTPELLAGKKAFIEDLKARRTESAAELADIKAQLSE